MHKKRFTEEEKIARHKECQRRYYQKSKERRRAMTYECTRRQREKTKKWFEEIRTNKPCTDCGNIYPYYVMDFDHLPQYNKIKCVSTFASGGSQKRMEQEIKKCELVCSNCHRARTHLRRTEPS